MKSTYRAIAVIILTLVAVSLVLVSLVPLLTPVEEPVPVQSERMAVFEDSPPDGTGVPAKPVFVKVIREVIQ